MQDSDRLCLFLMDVRLEECGGRLRELILDAVLPRAAPIDQEPVGRISRQLEPRK